MVKLNVFNYSIKNAADTLDVHIDGVIVDAETQQMLKDFWGDETSVSFKSFRDQVLASDASTVNVHVNSYGGHVGDAMAIHDLLVELQNNGRKVNTKGRGIIASAATYILMAGNSEMSANSWFMIHNVSGGIMGDVNAIESYANTLRKFNDATRDFYASATGIRKEDITKMMNAETWLTANEAKDKGFVKSVSSSQPMTNSIDPAKWPFQNQAILNLVNSSVKYSKMIENGSFQNTLQAAKAEAFEVVDGGFLATEDHLNAIEAKITDLTGKYDSAVEANTGLTNQLEAEQNAHTESKNALNTANAEITRLHAEVERLNGMTGAIATPGKTDDKFEPVDPEAKYLTSVDAEAAKLRGLRN